MLPSREHPERGRFVRDQVAALRELEGLDVECYEFAPGAKALMGAAADLGRRYRRRRFDIVHAHFGLTAWPALAVRARARGVTLHGTDLAHPRTRLATGAALPFMDLVAAASDTLIEKIPGHRARARARTLPCGVDTARFVPMPRTQARAALNLQSDPPLEVGPDAPPPYERSGAALELPADAPLLLFGADPPRAEKRYDRARALADAAGARLLTLGGVAPERVPLYVNAANAVIVPSEREGFGLAVLEALACDVPVLATPVGIHQQALDGLAGTLCAPFDLAEWATVLAPHLARPDSRVAGRTRAERFSARRMAERVAGAWCTLMADAG
jgi:teichuronic acid biosynthesis glycosyltransferase TuaC